MTTTDWKPHYIDRPVDHARDCAYMRKDEGAGLIRFTFKIPSNTADGLTEAQISAIAIYRGTEMPSRRRRDSKLRPAKALPMCMANLTSTIKLQFGILLS